MQKTRIEWCNYSINPVKGLCPMACPYCYARRLYNRLKWNPKIVWSPQAFDILDKRKCCDGLGIKQPSRIFVGSTFELFLNSLPENWMEYNLATIRIYPQHTFIFLTKQPQNLIKWSPFPNNCWVGVSPITNGQLLLAIGQLQKIQAKVKFLSIEPMLNELNTFKFAAHDNCLDWVIIGRRTPVSKTTAPKLEWIEEIVTAASKANIPVFLKNNLETLIPQEGIYAKLLRTSSGKLRQEFP